jgi:hypothetical protein
MRRVALLTISALLLLTVAGTSRAAGQSQSSQPQQGQPLSLAHLYWHFLDLQHQLDVAAARREKQGKDGQWLRDSLKNSLGFNDANFAPIRASADRLYAEQQALYAQASAIVAAMPQAGQSGQAPPGSAPPGIAQLTALDALREANIAAEIAAIGAALSPQDKATLENYLTTQFSLHVSVVSAGQVKNPPTASNSGSVQP